jgi:hypothetical protein
MLKELYILGGGIRGQRPKYARTGYVGPTVDSYGGSGIKRVFISFHIQDEAQVELLRQQAKDPRFNIKFIDYSVKEPFDNKWKTRCTERIKRSSLFVCMIGPDTYKREAVLWEINKAHELGKKVIGVRIYRDKKHKIPEPLVKNNDKIIYWNIDDISREVGDT